MLKERVAGLGVGLVPLGGNLSPSRPLRPTREAVLMHAPQQFLGLLTRKERWGLSGRGWLIVFATKDHMDHKAIP